MLRALIIGLALAAAFAPLDATSVERWYSTGLYPMVQRVMTPVSNLVPFAWLDVIGAPALIVVLVFLVQAISRCRRRKWKSAAEAVARLVTLAAVVYLLFLGLWGFNYRRLPMTARLVVDRAAPSTDAVVMLGLTAVEQLNTLYAPAHEAGWRTAPWRSRDMQSAFALVQGWLSDASAAAPGRLKWSVLGPYFRWAGVDGMINPFGLEAIGNPDLLDFERPFVAAHEWAHLAGYADESEASFVGWLTCVHADPPAAYSGWLFLYWQIRSEVGAAERERLLMALGAGPRRDVDAIADRLRRGEIPLLRTASWNAYDKYLKANRVEQGIRSYGAVVRLVAGARFEKDWRPIRRQ